MTNSDYAAYMLGAVFAVLLIIAATEMAGVARGMYARHNYDHS